MSEKLNLLITKDVPESIRKLFFSVQTWARNMHVPVAKIGWPFEIVLARDATDKTTTSTTYTRCSAPVRWNPTNYPTTDGKWYLECAVSISNASGTVYARLYGTEEIGVVSLSGTTDMQLVSSEPLTMPSIPMTVYVQFRSSSSSYTARFAGARLVFVPD